MWTTPKKTDEVVHNDLWILDLDMEATIGQVKQRSAIRRTKLSCACMESFKTRQIANVNITNPKYLEKKRTSNRMEKTGKRGTFNS